MPVALAGHLGHDGFTLGGFSFDRAVPVSTVVATRYLCLSCENFRSRVIACKASPSVRIIMVRLIINQAILITLLGRVINQ
ncbi:hypothetical protein, partial [Malikia spinosa]|uniref:hypothetical protein n=1 Tax=Malikia spinosa TaxID=86180 RepID=UPI001B8072D8